VCKRTRKNFLESDLCSNSYRISNPTSALRDPRTESSEVISVLITHTLTALLSTKSLPLNPI